MGVSDSAHGEIVGDRFAVRLGADAFKQFVCGAQMADRVATVSAGVQQAAVAMTQQPAIDQSVVGSDGGDCELEQACRLVGIPGRRGQPGPQTGELTVNIHVRLVDMPCQALDFAGRRVGVTELDQRLDQDRPPRDHRHLRDHDALVRRQGFQGRDKHPRDHPGPGPTRI